MADCGATGTALDRVTAAVTNANGGVVKHASNLVMPVLMNANGNATNVYAQTAPTLTGYNNAMLLANRAQTVQHHDRQYQPQLGMMPQQYEFQRAIQHQQHAMQASMMQQQQHQAIMAMQQQHQMMHQQQHMMQVMQMQQHAQQQHKAQVEHQQKQNNVTVDNWHEGLEKDVNSALNQHYHDQDDVVTVGDEGIAKAATMEELAAAWAEAQDDYDHITAADEATNMWSGPAEEYDFFNKLDATETNIDQHDYVAQGMREFEAGNIREAIRAFELELQYTDNDNAFAWRMLGQCHAENDQDREAIICLEQAVDRDPYSPQALLALGVSSVNELNHSKALSSLKAWITHNPKYAGLELESYNDMYSDGATLQHQQGQEAVFEEAQQLLLRALEFDPNDAAEVWEALGVVYNVSRDYDAAIDAFKKALQARGPNDYQLWNKLGATLANAGKSEEALPAYKRALEIKPKYARAWLNMAISYSNLQNFDQAARCYLQTLSLNPSAVHCWSYLRIALSCAERWDLIPLAAAQNIEAFEEHFDFVSYKSGQIS